MIIKFLNLIIVYLLILFIRAYQLFISPVLKPNCRYLPTCSDYSISALRVHGLANGIFYSVKRIFSCHPLGGQGHDPVPKKISED
jgi:hypothetical protein